MGFLNGLKVLWSDPELRNKAIAYTLGATAVTCAASYAVTKAITRREKEGQEQGRVITIDGELYQELPNGDLRPYHAPRHTETHYRERYDEYKECEYKECEYEECEDASNDDILYIKGRPYTMETYGNYVPVRMPSATRRKPSKKHYR